MSEREMRSGRREARGAIVLVRRLLYLLRWRRMDAELREEMAFHREELARRNVGARGFGNATLAIEDARGVWMWRWLEDAWQDARYTIRALTRSPAFSAAAIAIVALGAGATLAVFSLLDSLVLRSLPVERPERLVWFRSPAFSYPIYREVKARMPVFDGMFGWNVDRAYVDWTGRQGELAATDVLEVTGGFFPTLRVTTEIGRAFQDGDGAAAVITHAAWTQRFGSDPSVLGRSILVGDKPFTIVGVAPRGFFGVAPGLAPEVIVSIEGRYGSADSVFTSTTTSWLHLMARLKDGVSLPQAQAALATVWPGVLEATTSPDAPAARRSIYLGRTTALESGRTGYSRVRNQFGDPLWVLMGLVSLLLAVACASIANLLLARGVHRRREIAVRLAIGANRSRVFRQLLTEALVLTIAGIGAGLILASWSSGLLVHAMQTDRDASVLDTTLGWRTLVFSGLLALLVSVVSAVLPAFEATRKDVTRGLKEHAAGGVLRRMSAGRALVSLQVALAVVLLGGAAVFSRSLARLLAQDTGVEASRILVVALDSAATGYKDAAQRAFDLELLERLRRAPGVESAAASWMPPISNSMGNWTQSIGVDGRPISSAAPYVYFNGVSPDYFATVGMRLRRGRGVSSADVPGAPRVVVINESLARQFFPGQDPVGRHITIGRAAGRKDLEIVGVVQDAKYRTLQEPPRNIAYLPVAQAEDVTRGRDLFVELRTASPAAVAASVRQIVRGIDRRMPFRVETVADRVRESTLTERVMAVLAGGLGAAALLLACASLYGLLAYTVSRRRREIGVRLALGARHASVMWLVQRESLALTAAGIAAGLGATIVLARFVGTSLLFQTAPTDPIALGISAVVMLAIASAAAYVPARAALRIDPVRALRSE